MNNQSFPHTCWHEGANYPSPVQRVLALGFYDGPTEGALLCAPEGQVYKFEMLAWDESTQDLRVFGLAPLPQPAWEQLTSLYARHETPHWPVWVPSWYEDMDRQVDSILKRAGPVEWAVATQDLRGDILRARAIRPEEGVRVTDWAKFLGLAQEAPGLVSLHPNHLDG